MTDETECTVHKSGGRYQLTNSKVDLGISSGITWVTVRLDEQPAESPLSPTWMEKDLRSVISEGAMFTKALGSAHLRAEVLTDHNELVNVDLDTAGIREAHEHIVAGCSGQPVAATIAAANAGRGKPAAAAPLCPPLVMQRMRAKNFPRRISQSSAAGVGRPDRAST